MPSTPRIGTFTLAIVAALCALLCAGCGRASDDNGALEPLEPTESHMRDAEPMPGTNGGAPAGDIKENMPAE